MTTLIIGASGVVGSGILKYYSEKKEKVIATTLKTELGISENVRHIYMDISDKDYIDKIEPYFNKITGIVFNAAAVPKTETTDQIKLIETNVIPLANLLEYLKNKHPRIPFCYISGHFDLYFDSLSDEHIYRKFTEYHTSKIMAEIVCNNYMQSNINPICIQRVSAPYSYNLENLSVLPRFIKNGLNSNDIEIWGKGKRRQTFTFAEDIGQSSQKAISSNYRGILNINSGYYFSMHQLAKRIIKILPKCSSKIIKLDKDDPLEKVNRKIPIIKAEKEIGFKPKYSFEETIIKILEKNNSSVNI